MAGLLRGHAVLATLALLAAAALLAPGAAAEEAGQHVVGGDRGWDAAANIAQWAAGKVFKVGDSIWFMYSAADESIAEVGSREELDACDVSNPIRLYTDGLNEVLLDAEGPRYFASARPENCRGGMKLHVAVQPPPEEEEEGAAAAEAPAAALVAGGYVAPGAESPTACGTVRLSVSFLLCSGMALLRFAVA